MDILPNTFLGWELAGVTPWLAVPPNPRHSKKQQNWVWEQPWAPHAGWYIWDDLWRDNCKENPFWVITRGSLLRSPLRTDFQEPLSYPQRNKPQKWHQSPKNFVPFMVKTQHSHPGMKSWDWPHGNPPQRHLRPSQKQGVLCQPQGSPARPPRHPNQSIPWSQPMNGHSPLPHDLYNLHRIPNTFKGP